MIGLCVVTLRPLERTWNHRPARLAKQSRSAPTEADVGSGFMGGFVGGGSRVFANYLISWWAL